jgi:hypothetical protein
MAAPTPGSWALAEELFERGDAGFVDELRRVTDAERLGAFAARWLADRRPVARQFLFDYLDRPLNAYRHEALVKRLFKRAEAAGDDELMGAFLALFDRSIRKAKRRRSEYRYKQFSDRADAERQLAAWRAEGFEVHPVSQFSGRIYASANRSRDVVIVPANTTMFRPQGDAARKPPPAVSPRELQRRRLFTPRTRKYLRRRAWRYFRNLGKNHPERYVPAVAAALRRYTDADVPDGIALLDNWSLVHILFHHSPALIAKSGGWELRPGHTLDELSPAPAFEGLWVQVPGRVLDLASAADCRPIRVWAVRMLETREPLREALSVESLFGLLGHADPAVVTFAAGALRTMPGVESVAIDRWLALLDSDDPQVLELVCGLMIERLGPERVSVADAVRLARSRPLSVARLGFEWLRAKPLATAEDEAAVRTLADAECEAVRPEMIRWLKEVMRASPRFEPVLVLDLLDSRFSDVRAEGWRWLSEEAALRDDPAVWSRLLESPYDDVRLPLIADLEEWVARGGPAPATRGADPARVRFLWASVLLNVHRGSRVKPAVVGQVAARLREHPQEGKELLPMLAVALRSVRGPEFRTGLAAVVRLVRRRPELAATVRQTFPELELSTV